MGKNLWKLVAVGSVGYALGSNARSMPRYSYGRNSIIGNLKARINDKVNSMFGCKSVSYYVGGEARHYTEENNEEI